MYSSPLHSDTTSCPKELVERSQKSNEPGRYSAEYARRDPESGHAEERALDADQDAGGAAGGRGQRPQQPHDRGGGDLDPEELGRDGPLGHLGGHRARAALQLPAVHRGREAEDQVTGEMRRWSVYLRADMKITIPYSKN